MTRPSARASLIAGLAGTLMLAAGAPAQASDQFQQGFEIEFARAGHAVTTPDVSSGFRLLTTQTDPGAPNAKPARLARVTVTLPKGARFDTGALATCGLANLQDVLPGACPA